jgi:hypothetical protein
MDGASLTMPRHFCISEAEKPRLHKQVEQAHLTATGVRTRSIGPNLWGRFMSAQDLPVMARGMAVIVAIALVATALAPLILTAARIVA